MTMERTNAYYDADDLNRFAEMGQCASPLCFRRTTAPCSRRAS